MNILIESTDHQIDKLVYEPYSLTDDEIKVVEGEGKERANKNSSVFV